MDNYLKRLKEYYSDYPDNSSMLALADIDKLQDRARELSIFREMEKTQEIIEAAVRRYRICLEKLTNSDTASKMTDYERAHCFASMDWCVYTLDIVGEDPKRLTQQANEMVEGFARKVGFIPN